jgi:hypothetical protein
MQRCYRSRNRFGNPGSVIRSSSNEVHWPLPVFTCTPAVKMPKALTSVSSARMPSAIVNNASRVGVVKMENHRGLERRAVGRLYNEAEVKDSFLKLSSTARTERPSRWLEPPQRPFCRSFLWMIGPGAGGLSDGDSGSTSSIGAA